MAAASWAHVSLPRFVSLLVGVSAKSLRGRKVTSHSDAGTPCIAGRVFGGGGVQRLGRSRVKSQLCQSPMRKGRGARKVAGHRGGVPGSIRRGSTLLAKAPGERG